MLNENKFICVDQRCQEFNKIIDNWEYLVKHQKQYHKMLTLSQFFESMKQVNATQTSKQNIIQINNITKDYERNVEQIITIIHDKTLSLISEYFIELQKKIIQNLQGLIYQRQDKFQYQLDEFYFKIFQTPYQESLLQQFQGQNLNQWVHDEAKKYLQEVNSNVNNFYQQFQSFLDLQKEKEKFQSQTFNMINKNSQALTSFHSEKEIPLKNYRKLEIKSLETEDKRNVFKQDQVQNNSDLNNQQTQPTPKKRLVLSLKSAFVKAPQLELEVQEYFNVPKFEYLTGDVTDFSSNHMYGPLEFKEMEMEFKSVETYGDGMILFEGFINKQIHQNFSIQILKQAQDYYVEIGVIDWNKFQFPKLNAPQKGVYSYNNKGEIFDDEELKLRKAIIMDDRQLFVTYNCDCQSLIFKVKQNQAISLKNVQKNKLTFFARISKAQIILGL